MDVGLGAIAAWIHRKMCDDGRFGYSWEERWGAYPEWWEAYGHGFNINVGDYDCSSSTITAWKLALLGTAYEGALDGATYTGNMRSVLVGSGLFEWKPMSFDAQPGDLYLNEANHVAMCQQNDSSADILSEFSSNEYGGAYGGQRGDQTGWESHLTGYYDYPWDGILHYNGKADGASGGSTPAPAPTPKRDAEQPKWRVRQDGKWLAEGECGRQGRPITAIAVDMPGWYQVQTKNDGWLPPVTGYDVGDPENGYAGEEQADNHIIAVRCYYETQEPAETGYYAAKYRVSDLDAGWHPYQYDDDVDESQDGYAGDEYPVDRFEICIERV